MAYTPPNGNNVNLDFGGSYTPPNGDNVNLNFSDENYIDRSVTIGFVLSKPVLSATINAAEPPAGEHEVVVSLVLSKPVFSAQVDYNPNISITVNNQSAQPWHKGNSQIIAAQSNWQKSAIYRQEYDPLWGVGEPITSSLNAAHEDAQAAHQSIEASWAVADSITQAVNEQFTDLDRLRLQNDVTWQQGQTIAISRNERFKDLYRLRADVRVPWQKANLLSMLWTFKFSLADLIHALNWIIWENAQKPPIGRSAANHIEPPKPPEYQGSTLLNFACEMCCIDPINVVLNFGEEPCPTNHKAIYIVNEVSMKRVSDDVDIDIFNAQLGIDTDSWGWSLSATIPKSELSKVNPSVNGPVEVELHINGFEWCFIVESYDKDDVFAKTTVKISGRSATAYLDVPYAPVRSYTQVEQAWAKALAENELSRNGEASPFSLNWQLIDELGWNVLNNSFSYSNLTPLAAIRSIAESVGGFVNSDPYTKTLHVMPRYKFPAWEIGTQVADKTINYDFVTHESFKWDQKPAYNGIYVSGENTGVTALVKRTGTDGAEQAPMIVNQLITDEPAARQLGMTELSKGGKQAMISIDLPIIAETGLLLPAMLIDFEVACAGSCDVDLIPWRGIVRGISIDVSEEKVIQTIELERRYDE